MIHTWLTGPLDSDVQAALERLTRSEDVQRIAVMPDVHLAREVCVGTVLATSRLLYPSAIGGDIGCGMAAMRFHCDARVIASPTAAARVFEALYDRLPARRRSRGDEDAWAPPHALSHPKLVAFADKDGAAQLGTLGSGNHFLELQEDDAGALWAMVHTGSRGIGQQIRDHHLLHARETATGMHALDAETDAGRGYLHDVRWAVHYAEASRRRILERLANLMRDLFGVDADLGGSFDCHHNYIAREDELWVHRKGAIAAHDGELGITPGSMGTQSFHVRGKGKKEALCSSAHGAGRARSRSETRKRVSVRRLGEEMRGVYYDHRIADGLRDEAPSAYKAIDEVMRAQQELTAIVRTLRPLLSYKGV
ncbi:MAG: RtcB family protein [Deltaproteobacteria bacterium]|nr:RtcB family protein [Deltaproteobacteria bacterium]